MASSLKEKKKNHDKFNPGWKVLFPWVSYDEDKHKMYCTSCLDAKKLGFKVTKQNCFVTGSGNFQKSALRRHVDGATKAPCATEHKHLQSQLRIFGKKPRPLQVAVDRSKQRAVLEDSLAITTLFNAVYFLTVSEQPLARFEDQVK